MSERFVIEVSNEVATKLRRIAKLTGQSVEALIVKLISSKINIDDPIEIQLERVPRYSYVQLWSIVERNRLSVDAKTIALCTQVLLRLRELGYDVNKYIQENNLKIRLEE